MVESEERERTKWLTYLVYLILTFQTVTLGWLVVKYAEMPDKFVRLERYSEDRKASMDRYTYDMTRMENLLAAIDRKLDKIVKQ